MSANGFRVDAEAALWREVVVHGWAQLSGSKPGSQHCQEQEAAVYEAADRAVIEYRARCSAFDASTDVAKLRALVMTKERERVAMERDLSDAKSDALILRYALLDGNAGLATNEQGRDARHALARLTGFGVTFAGLLLDLEMFADKDGEGGDA